MGDEVIRMTRAQYEATYGAPPPMPSMSSEPEFQTTPGRAMVGGAVNFLDNLTLGAGDEITGAGTGLLSALSGNGYGAGYDQGMQEARDLRQEYRTQAGPGIAIASDLVGGAFLPVGKALKEAKGIGNKLLEAMKLGTGIGGTAGFLEGEGGFGNRVKGSVYGAAAGAAASPLIVGAMEGVGRLANQFTKTGQQRVAADQLERFATPEGTKNLDLNAMTPEGPYGPKSFAEVAQTPGAANLEMAMRQDGESGSMLLKALGDRAALRKESLQELVPDEIGTVTGDVRGAAIREAAAPIATRAADAEANAWGQFTGVKQGVIDAEGVKGNTLSLADKLRTPLGFSSDANKVIKAIVGSEEDLAMSGGRRMLAIEDYQKIRSAAGEVMADAASKGRNREAALMAEIRNSLDEAATEAANGKGGGSVSSETLQRFKEALAVSRQVKGTYGTGVPKEILAKGENGFRVLESRVPQRVTETPEGAKQFMKAFGSDKEAVQEARGAILDKVMSGPQDSWAKKFEKNRPQLLAIFGEDFMKVKAAIDDIGSEESVAQLSQLATGRGPITSQRLTTAKDLDRSLGMGDGVLPVLTGALGASVGGALAGKMGAGTGTVAALAVSSFARGQIDKGRQAIKALIAQGLKDPRFANELRAVGPNKAAEELEIYFTQQAARMSGRGASVQEPSSPSPRFAGRG